MVSVVMGQEAIRAVRGRLWSPGRPSGAQREDRVRFWEAVAGGVSSEDAAGVAGVSPAVGSRWFRQAGGMPPISLGGMIARPDGELVPGPQVRWTGRRHGPRKDRRWATSWSPEQISNRLRVDFCPIMSPCESLTKPSTRRPMCKVEVR